ncbi:hypothetical protein CLPU_5c00010 [Gottschalkia purinilytica]|uniref:DUF4489 domain-containing protein n=1 Tax=Gottschalkia purinilytica TaxID=1503 RepID=A0A0L0WAZ1_GOTPU|nr:DUF4489 domain-containing protein [Gottschalkia purinilytica]KNF08694.1 hypothetical protein CLPU_5c00010 [Gottschalkia purinilytica]
MSRCCGNFCNFGEEVSCCRSCCRQDCCRTSETIFECNPITGAMGVPVIAIGSVVTPTTIGTITADLSCMSVGCVNIQFTTLITFTGIIAIGTVITFRVFRRCSNDSQEVEVDSLQLTQTVLGVVGTTIPVSHSVCDCGLCASRCCTYRVTVEATATLALASGFNVSGGAITLIAGSRC